MTKMIWTKIKDAFNLSTKNISPGVDSTISDPNNEKVICDFNKSSLVNIPEQNYDLHAASTTPKTWRPLFAIGIGIVDMFMLLIVYIVQEGSIITSGTWIKMGCKYVPCMKPLDSRFEQEMYNVELQSVCHSFLFPYQFFRLLTPIFLHSSLTHLLNNFVYRVLAEGLLQGKYGLKTLVICYLLFGSSANIMSALCNPKTSKYNNIIKDHHRTNFFFVHYSISRWLRSCLWSLIFRYHGSYLKNLCYY